MQRGVVGEIISRFENKGMVLKALKTYACPKAVAEEHYRDLSSKPFFGDLVDYICSGPVVAMIWEGPGAVKSARLMIGATNPLESAPGTIRGDLAVEVGRNVIPRSDSVESAERESRCGSAMRSGAWIGNPPSRRGCLSERIDRSRIVRIESSSILYYHQFFMTSSSPPAR